MTLLPGMLLLLVLATGCQSAVPAEEPTPSPTPLTTATPSSTATPTPDPTATPEPTPTAPPPPTPVTQAPRPAIPAAPSSLNPALVARGRQLFFQVDCAACHGDAGEGIDGPRIANTERSFAEVLRQVRTPEDVMDPFPPSVLSDQDVRAIYEFLKSLP